MQAMMIMEMEFGRPAGIIMYLLYINHRRAAMTQSHFRITDPKNDRINREVLCTIIRIVYLFLAAPSRTACLPSRQPLSH